MNSLILKTKRAVIFGKNLLVTFGLCSAETLGTRERFGAIGVRRKRVKKTGIWEVLAIFWTTNMPPRLKGFKLHLAVIMAACNIID